MNIVIPIVCADVFVTAELCRRAPKKVDYLREKTALQSLAVQMADAPDNILPRLVDLAMEITGAVSGGLSLYEPDPAPGIFRWQYLRGLLEKFAGATTPRDHSPCGVCIDSKGPILSRHPERFYDWIAEANISVPELLLVPLYINGSLPLGTLWIVSAAEGHFDSGDARVLTELASFAGIALRMLESERQLKAALQRQAAMTKEQEIVAREMHHRVKNLFAITNGMIRVSARSASTPLEMADILTGRLHALSSAHALVRRSPEDPPTIIGSHIHEVITTILRPHEDSGTARNRFVVKGPPIRLGDRATNGVALVFHELATNAVKYGALRAENGSVEVSWRQDGGTIFLQWNERGGPPVGGAPSNTGFGTALSKNTVVGQLGGTLYYDWRPEGLRVSISVPADNLAV